MKKGSISGPGLAKGVGMTFVAGCPVVSLPHKHGNWSLSMSMSIAEEKGRTSSAASPAHSPAPPSPRQLWPLLCPW